MVVVVVVVVCSSASSTVVGHMSLPNLFQVAPKWHLESEASFNHSYKTIVVRAFSSFSDDLKSRPIIFFFYVNGTKLISTWARKGRY